MVLIHKPLLTSPLGSPIRLLTAIDIQMANNILKKQGKLNEKTYEGIQWSGQEYFMENGQIFLCGTLRIASVELDFETQLD
jgi:hypothetical protein